MSDVQRAAHDWRPSTLVGDLMPTFSYNVRLSSGTLARVWFHAGRWNVRHEDGSEVTDVTLDAVCAWLNAHEARPLR